jgi:putative transposase
MIPIEHSEDYLIDQNDRLKKLLTWFLNLVMQLEAIQQSDAEPYQRIDSRKAHRNGYKERSLKTRVGEIRLMKPQFREISLETKVFDRYSRVEKALINAVLESYLQGISNQISSRSSDGIPGRTIDQRVLFNFFSSPISTVPWPSSTQRSWLC